MNFEICSFQSTRRLIIWNRLRAHLDCFIRAISHQHKNSTSECNKTLASRTKCIKRSCSVPVSRGALFIAFVGIQDEVTWNFWRKWNDRARKTQINAIHDSLDVKHTLHLLLNIGWSSWCTPNSSLLIEASNYSWLLFIPKSCCKKYHNKLMDPKFPLLLLLFPVLWQ